jgi:hypothetical protein
VKTERAESNCCVICEQTVRDPITGFTLQFDVLAGDKRRSRLRLGLGLNLGHREFTFDENGMFCGSIRTLPFQLKPYQPPDTPWESD